MLSKVLKGIGYLVGGIVALLLLAITVASFVPIKHDPDVRADHGAGASSVEPSTSGLLREFPPSTETADNPTIPEKVALGRLLFFDPILSQDNERSCASCHHPDLGFSDGRTTPEGLDGTDLSRNVPTLWNVAYVNSLFWDGRVDSLEAQLLVPLTHPNEMGVTDTEG
ncbi:MAG: cytochrome-c peroxidase, partial [Anaerolineae bacterium]